MKTQQDLISLFQHVAAEVDKREFRDVTAESIITDLGIDSLSMMQIVGEMELRLGIMIPYFASAFGTFLLRQTFRAVPRDLEDAAAIDGCGSLQTIWNVFLPLAKPTLVAFSIVSVVYHYNEFLWPLIITDTERARTVTVGLASFTQSAESGAQWNLIAAGTVIVILPLLVVFILFQRRFVESFMYSGIKG